MAATTTAPLALALDCSELTSSAFTSEADFLNRVLLGGVDAAQPERDLGQVVHALDVALADTDTSLDRAIADVSSSVPRVAFDLQLLRENALLVRFLLDSVRTRHARRGDDDSDDVGHTIDRVRVLDLVKTRIEAARDVLREAESWTTLESEVTSLVAEREYTKAAERLDDAARSMVVFDSTPEYDHRRQVLVSLQNQLEASLSPGVVQTVRDRDVKQLKQFSHIFSLLRRDAEFKQYYFGERRSRLVDSWHDAPLIDCQAAASPPSSSSPSTATATTTITRLSPSEPLTLSDYLATEFYPLFLRLVVEERTYLPAIFPDPQRTLSELITTTLEHALARPATVANRLELVAAHNGGSSSSSFLVELIKAFHATEQFATQVEHVFEKLDDDANAAAAAASHVRVGEPESTRTTVEATTIPAPAASATARPRSLSSTATATMNKQRSRSLSKRLSSRSVSYALGRSPLLVSGDPTEPESDGADATTATEQERDEVVVGVVRAWETALFEPFLDYQVEYAALEREYLAREISIISNSRGGGGQAHPSASASSSDWIDSVLDLGGGSGGGDREDPEQYGRRGGGGVTGLRVLVDRATRVLGACDDAVGRNVALTHGYGSAGLVTVVDDAVTQWIDARTHELARVMRERNHPEPGGGRGGVTHERTNGRRGNDHDRDNDDEDELGMLPGGGGGGLVRGGVLEGLEYSGADWETFQFGLKLLDACRTVRDKVGQFEAKLAARLVALGHSIRQQRPVPGTTRGEILLLRQSTLNSFELNDLFDRLASSGRSRGHLVSRAKSASVELTRTTQLFLHEVLLAPLVAHLAEYASLACWTATTSSSASAAAPTMAGAGAGGKAAAGAAQFDLAIPTFSLSPTELVSRVGEGLFNLPRLFEVYAQDDALSYSLETLPFVDVDAIRALFDPPPPPPPAAAPPMLRQSSSTGHRPSLSSHSHPPPPPLSSPPASSSSSSPAPPPPPPPPPPSLSAETVIATWLSSLTLSIVSHLTSDVLPKIARLSKPGLRQLGADLDYVSNVARALLDFDSATVELEAWRKAVQLEDDHELVVLATTTTTTAAERQVYERVARLRGVLRKT
ncbi:hypothetical protein JCM11491_004225 [Sporobolomyces phaffii]